MHDEATYTKKPPPAFRTSETFGEVAKALVKAQAAMPGAIKTDAANPHFNSKYASLAAVSAAVMPPFHKAGLAVLMSQSNGSFACRLLHESGEWYEVAIPLSSSSADSPQAVGSTITYARRYLLGLVSGVPTDEDDDGNAASANRGNVQESRTPAQTEHAPSGTFPVGKHKGEKVEDIPGNYLEWCAGNMQNQGARAMAVAELARRSIGTDSPMEGPPAEEPPPLTDDNIPF